MVRRLRFSGPKTSIICTPMTSLKTSIKTITYLSDTGCLEIQGASLFMLYPVVITAPGYTKYLTHRFNGKLLSPLFD
ncbi:nitrite extrusion protein 2 [Shigella dysenteriae 155-74]|nr:nitrite extrusion protein 2 [Shigella dysenteriae 155-74]